MKIWKSAENSELSFSLSAETEGQMSQQDI